jgi:transcriptional regulator with XRE-family HTH domain
MLADTTSPYRTALHAYAREFLRLLDLLGVSQADVARACGVTRPFVTFWVQGSRLVPPPHARTLRRLLCDAVTAQRQTLATADTATRQRVRDQLLPAILQLDGATQAVALAYVDSVRVLYERSHAYAEAMRAVACAPRVEEAAWQAVAHAQEALNSLHEIFGEMKTRNRQLKVVLDQRADLEDLLDYIVAIYGSEEHPPQEDAAPKEPHRVRRRHRRSTPTGTR